MGVVGDVTKYVVEAVADKVRDVFDDIFYTGSSSGYHPGPVETDAHAKKIADELAEMKESVRKSTEKTEKEIIVYINKSMYELIKILEKVNGQKFGDKSLNMNIHGIRTNMEDLKKEVVGYIGNILDERLVETDKELSVILAERNDEKRAKDFDAFCKRVQNQALDGLSKKLETTVHKQEEMIRREIESRLAEVDRNMKAASQAYESILRIKEKDESKMAETKIKFMYQYELSQILLDQIGG